MRVWGRTQDELGNKSWVQVNTDAAGLNDQVYLTALCQWLKLNLGESPMYGNAGIPAQQTIMTQVFPDFYANNAQQVFAPYFVRCQVQRVPNSASPAYYVNVTTHYGATISTQIGTGFPQ